MPVESLIFDLDGTLIDSSEGIVEAVNYSLRQMGQPEHPAESIKPFIGYSLATMYPRLTDAPVEELCRHFQVKAAETVVPSTRALDHVDSLLPELKAWGFRLGIASTKIARHIHGIIDMLGWGQLFDTVVGGDEVERPKPDPEAFSLALTKMECPPIRALVIGDTVNDVNAARKVPVKVAAVPSPYGGYDDLVASQPDYMLSDISKLPELLDRL